MFKIDQIESNGNILLDYDEKLSNKEILEVLMRYFPNLKNDDGMIIGKFEDKKYSIYCKNITYLGFPWQTFKKRIQIGTNFKQFCSKSELLGCTPLLLGIYKYKSNLLFADFKVEDYISKKANNSSAHLSTNDLRNACINKVLKKIDKNNNEIIIFSPTIIEDYLGDKLVGEKINPPAFVSHIDYILTDMKKDLYGIDCYEEMFNANFNYAKQAEWPGFYLEYLIKNYTDRFDVGAVLKYEQNKKDDSIDLDLFFPDINCHGDIKAHSNGVKEIPGNDEKTIDSLIENSNSIYYVVCNHDTIKDSERNYEVTKFWNKKLNKDDLMSYSSRMKNSIHVTDYKILEINKCNRKYVTVFNQGKNSNGKDREPKIKIKVKDLDNFIIYQKKL